MAIFMPYPISTRDTYISLRADMSADMSVSGRYGVGYENCHIIIYLSYIFLSVMLIWVMIWNLWYYNRVDMGYDMKIAIS